MQYTVVDGSGGAQPAAAEAAVRKGPWTMEEDLVLVNYVAANGEVAWNNLARAAGLNRTGKSCRLRWLNYLRPDVRRGSITPEEHLLIVELQARWGNRWSKIARHLPGRTDNEIKNFWRTKIQKKHRDNNSAGTSTTGSTEPAAGYQSTAAPAVAESQSSSVTPDYDFVAARQPGSSMRSQLDHHQQLQGYAVHGGGGRGGGGAACAVGGMNGAVSPEFLQAAAATAASGDNFWALEDFWPTVPSLHGDC